MSVIHTPKASPNTRKPTSGNKLLLQEDGGEEDRIRDKEAIEELGQPFRKSTEHADFAFKVLTELWAGELDPSRRMSGGRWRDEISGFSIFGQHLVDACGERGTDLLEAYLKADQVKYPVPTWMGEFLGLKIGKSKVVSLLKKIVISSRSIGLELIDMLKIIQSVNVEEGTFADFDFDELAVYAESLDKAQIKIKSSGKELNKLISTGTNSLVEICEAIFRAAAFMMCSHSREASEVESELNDDLESVESTKLQGIQDHLSATDLKLNDLSSAVERLTDIMASMMLQNDSSRTSKASPLRKQSSKVEEQAEKPKSFPRMKEGGNLKKSGFYSDSFHEKKAVSLSSSETLKKLIGSFDSKGSTFMNNADELLTFNDLFSRGTPPNQKFERLTTQPNKYMELTSAGDLIVPLLGLTQQPVNTRAVHSAVDKLGRTIVNGRAHGTILTRDVMHIQALDKQLTQTSWQSIASSSQGLPASYPHMVRMLTEQVASVKEVINSQGDFEDEGMMPLIEQNVALFIANMGEAAAKLLDGIKEPCMSPDGHWRGLMILFWHQYSRSFSSRKDDFHSVFYPEMLNNNFEDNREKLFNDYRFKTSQLTCDIGNAIKMSCWGCGVSDVSYQSCVTSECKKKRAEEEHLHVYQGKSLGPSGAKTYVVKLYKA